MANNLTAIIPVLQDAANMVARELTGFIPASFRNTSAARAAWNQTVNYPIVPAFTAQAVTPANVSPSGTDVIQGAGSIVMNNLRKTSWNFTGEEQRALANGDIAPYQDIWTQSIAQAIRVLVNEIEASLWVAAYSGASRAYGTAGVAPFATAGDLTDFANVAKILDDNGTPQSDRHLVVGGAAMLNLRGKQSVLWKVNEAGTEIPLRTGAIGEVMGLLLHNSGPVVQIAKGAGTGYVTSGSTGVGVNQIALVTGSGTVLPGDIVTFAGDVNNKYVVNVGVSAPGTITIGAPGARVIIPTSNAMTIGANYTPNIGLHRNALHLVMRAPETGNDSAADTVTVTDDQSGLVFQMARYAQYMQSSFEIRVLYGVKAVKPEFIATLMG
jgi:P22 coat protein - gene protein 5